LTPFTEFVLAHLPAPPVRVLEVGCGHGRLARDLDEAGHDVVAIDPEAPEGTLFRRIRLEDLDLRERFDAVVASHSFHHIHDLGGALDRVLAVLDSGPFVLDEFGCDRFDARTAEWYERQPRREGRPSTAGWSEHHAGNHTYAAIRAELDGRFEERYFAWTPYLYRHVETTTRAAEQTLIDQGAISAIGFRYVGIPRPRSALKTV
jgi:SAM-dependent methyltransferase